ncbi:MAG TPA: arylsulfatase [Gemmatimonadaceae bacterium]|jgi:arylsulfatase A-like enzyme|nr:arylsulfatase [Gemmatimonadaceae bacterium]
MSDRARALFTAVALFMSAIGANAQQPTPPAGSPGATKPLSGQQLPAPPTPFGGKIERNAAESTPYWAPRVVPPKGAPNVLLVMIDDEGYGASSTFGGVIPTPALDRIAAMGLRYTQFHSTALCSPTRAALITGRNHHSMGFGVVAEQSTGYPGYNSLMSREKATIGKILRDNGYRTSWFGKNHNTPEFQASQAGPFDQWPTGMGFDYFYGFVGGDANQWQPNLFRNTTPIYPYQGHPGWNLMTAMADDAIEYLHRITAINSEQPFFVYYVPGATHAPHHPTPEWIKKASDLHLFDKGWNALRDTIFANQKRLGVIPNNAQLTPWPDSLLKRWDKLTAEERKLFVRQADVYAAFLMYADNETGRVIQAIDDMGKLDNTLIIYIHGDNGTSAEGGLQGTVNEVAALNGVDMSVADQLKFYDAWGSDSTYPHMAVGWAWAFDTPFSWTKQIASHFGGTRQGLAIAWPKVIKDRGGIRNQFHHVIDIVPTILEATGIKAPAEVDGIPQKPIEGVSMMYTFDKANANVASTHHTQYFEMMGDHAIYHDGWIASTKVNRAPWQLAGAVNQNPAALPYELYDLTKDWTQFDDVAAKYPAKLKELEDLFWVEANKYQVLPLDASVATRFVAPRPSLAGARTDFAWSGEITGTPNGDAPNILNSSFTYRADVEIPQLGADGMLVTQGGRFGGYGFYILHEKPVFVYNFLDMKRTRWEGTDALTPGKHTLEFEFTYDGLGAGTLAYNNVSGVGRGATGVLKVDGKEVARATLDHTVPFIWQWDENFDIGADTGTPVTEDYQTPFRFTGKLTKLTLHITRPQLTAADMAKLKTAARRAGDR